MPLDFAADSVVDYAVDFPKVQAPGEIDVTRRLVGEEDTKYRITWVIEYLNGTSRVQYTRNGGQVFQTLFGKIPHVGVKRILVFDSVLPVGRRQIATIPVPPDAEVSILYNCAITLNIETGDKRPKVERIYTFGWEVPGGGEKQRQYLHVDPSKDPVLFMVNSKEII